MQGPTFLEPGLLDACVHCGLCLQACPTFRSSGREEESPRGRLLLMDGAAHGRWSLQSIEPHIDACLGCRSCETACPADVPYGAALESTREALVRSGGASGGFTRMLVRHVLWRRTTLRVLGSGARGLHLSQLGHRLARWNLLPAPWRERLRLAPTFEQYRAVAVSPSSVDAPRVVLLRGCVASAWFSETEAAMVTLLHTAGYQVRLLDTPSCCGALAAHSGEATLAHRLVSETLASVQPGDRLIPTASGCGAHLLAAVRRSAHANEVQVMDLSLALTEAPKPLQFTRSTPIRVAYQDACHLRHGQGITEPPRVLLRAAGAEIQEIADADLCCGSAGTFNLEHPQEAAGHGARKAAALAAVNPEVVITANPGCLVQLQAHLRGTAIPVSSLARFLAARL